MRAAAAGALLTLAACAAVVEPPPAPERPVRAALLDHGRHASLLLERPGEGMVRYSYGDWDWYALGRTSVGQGSAALLWPTQGALGRRRLPGPATPEAATAQVRVAIEDALWFDVEAAKAQALADELDSVFAANADTLVYNRAFDLELVHHPDRYTLTNNSNRRVADWIEALGGQVAGPVLLSDWRLRNQQ
ncbi:MAG: hypothetical protein ACK4QW_19260 [Alphaproteobacteria bacterium]